MLYNLPDVTVIGKLSIIIRKLVSRRVISCTIIRMIILFYIYRATNPRQISVCQIHSAIDRPASLMELEKFYQCP